MRGSKITRPWRVVAAEIILPALLAANLLAGVLFFVVLPTMEEALMDKKRDMIRELTATAVSIAADNERREQAGAMSGELARRNAIEALRALRYGPENKDYFWITTVEPIMVMHPYMPELEGLDLSDFTDAEGNRLFADMVQKATSKGEGYADYLWQWKDDAGRVSPKLSYVKYFEPWGWVIGTGVYVDDVQQELADITRRLWIILISITLAVAALLGFITMRSLRIAKQREQYARGLKESRERYRTLLESTSEGVMLVVNDSIAYTNQTLQRLLGYSADELSRLPLKDLFLPGGSGDIDLGEDYLQDFISGFSTPEQFEAVLRTKNGQPVDAVLLCSRMSMGVRSAVSVIVRDMRQQKELAAQFDASLQRLDFLTGAAGLGVFRASASRKGRFLDANTETVRLMGYESQEQLLDEDLDSVFADSAENSFLSRLLAKGSMLHQRFARPGPSGASRYLEVSATVSRDSSGFPTYVDGIVEDVTDKVQAERTQGSLLAELQTANDYMSRPVRELASPVPVVPGSTPIQEAAQMMSEAGLRILLVGEGGIATGTVTEHDMQERVLSAGLDPARPVSDIMTAPVISIREDALASEALVAFVDNRVRHLIIQGSSGRPAMALEARALLHGQKDSVSVLLWELKRAATTGDLLEAQARLPVIVRSLVENRADPAMATRIFATVSDAVTVEFLKRTIQDMGQPPARFCFLSMGSQGRLEQTLKTDQDNAIIFEDQPPAKQDSTQKYFLELGRRVCTLLDQAGYSFCEGGVMAQNEQWCQPLSVWKDNFSTWVREADPEALLQTKIFFDFRWVYGTPDLTEALRDHLDERLEGRAAFFNHLVKNCLLSKPPRGLWGGIVTESGGDQSKWFSIKKAMTPVVDLARVYTLKHGIRATNTLERLRLAREAGALNAVDYDEASGAYLQLLQIRLTHQVEAIRRNGAPDNLISPDELTTLELVMLKEAFKQVGLLQKKLSFDFTGAA